MAPPNQGRKIAIIGGSGNIGSQIVPALLAKKNHTITAIQRNESSATFAPEVIVKEGALDNEAFLVDALKGQDVLIIVLSMEAMGLQEGIIRAAAKAGVEYVLPTEFGSDVYAKLADELPMIKAKQAPRQLINEIGVSSWIAVITNPWLEFCLTYGVLGMSIKDRTAVIVNGGNNKFSTSTLPRVGAAVAGLLSLPDAELAQYKNKPFYITSFSITQRELLASAFRATNTTEKDWTIVEKTTESIFEESAEGLKSGDRAAFFNIFLELHLREGYGGEFSDKVDLARFELDQEDLDETIARVAKAAQAVAE